MKAILPIFLILSFNLVNAQDSIRVTLCGGNDGCQLSKEIEHFDSLGRTLEIENYYMNRCGQPADLVMRYTSSHLFTYDSIGNVIIDEVRTGYSSTIVYTTYDSLSRIVANVYEQGNLGNTQVNGRDSTVYDINGNKIWFLAEAFNGTLWDTANYFTWQFDVNNRLIDYHHEQPFNIEDYLYQYDTIPYQITIYKSYIVNGSQVDSSRVIKKYYPNNRLEEFWNSQWDIAQVWNFIDRTRYEYDTIANTISTYLFDCYDTLCQDSVAKSIFSYDLAGRLIDESYYEYGWTLTGNSYTHYSGNIILDDGYHSVEQGCDDWEYNFYTYNLNLDLIHFLHITIHCTGDTSTCDYYILAGDSMLLASQSSINACSSDTIYPVITLAGGHEPYIIQWTPANGILDLDSLIPRIVVDSSITYQLTVTDSIGTTQTISVPINVLHSNFHLTNDTLVCQNNPLMLSANGNYSSYQWSTGSTNGVINVNTSVPDTLTIWLTVLELQCFYTDTINVTVDICAGIEKVPDNLVSIFPNPSNGNVTFNFDQTPNEITLIDNAGRIIDQMYVSKKTFTLKLNPGIYLAKLIFDKRVMYRKIIIQ